MADTAQGSSDRQDSEFQRIAVAMAEAPIWLLAVHCWCCVQLTCSPTASSDDMTLTSPSMDNSSAELLPSGDSPLNKRVTENLLASLSEHERAAILSVPAAQNPEDLRMFARWDQADLKQSQLPDN